MIRCDLIFLFIVLCQDFPSPRCHQMYDFLKEIDDNTSPATRRRKRAMATLSPLHPTPEQLKSPWDREQERKFWESRKLPVAVRTPRTVIF